jgi:predicted nucleotidyltransferase
MVAKSVVETVHEFAQVVKSRYPVKRIFLYGSHARGTSTPDSDIDVAVVLRNEPRDILQAEADLYRIGMDIDVRIEPIIVDEEHDPSGFYEDISSTGTVVYSQT